MIDVRENFHQAEFGCIALGWTGCSIDLMRTAFDGAMRDEGCVCEDGVDLVHQRSDLLKLVFIVSFNCLDIVNSPDIDLSIFA